MICFECGFQDPEKLNISMAFGVPLCHTHKKNIELVLSKIDGDYSLGILYYALKKIGLKPFIGWWNGQRHVPISFGRYRLNIEFYDPKLPHNHSLALQRQRNESFDHTHQFICIHLPTEFLNSYLENTVMLIFELHEGLRYYNA